MKNPFQTYRPKIKSVEAVKVTAENAEAIAEWCGGEISWDFDGSFKAIWVPSYPKTLTAIEGDYVVKDGNRFTVHDPADFDAAYEPATRAHRDATRGYAQPHPDPLYVYRVEGFLPEGVGWVPLLIRTSSENGWTDYETVRADMAGWRDLSPLPTKARLQGRAGHTTITLTEEER